MEQVNILHKNNGFDKVSAPPLDQANAGVTADQAFGRLEPHVQVNEPQTIGRIRACRASQREFQQARDRLKRANRDLGETTAFIVAALTTATAVQAVISFANDKVGISPDLLKTTFFSYILTILSLVAVGAVRLVYAMHRRAQAERELDRTKKMIFDFCPVEDWPKADE